MVDERIQQVINQIEKMIGVKLEPCDFFTGIRSNAGKEYFCAILKDNRVSESMDFNKLISWGGYKVEPCGVERIAIFLRD